MKTTKQVRIADDIVDDTEMKDAQGPAVQTASPKPPPKPNPKGNAEEMMEKRGEVSTAWKDPNTARWKKLQEAIARQAKGFKPGEVYGEEERALHNQTKKTLVMKATWEGKDTALVSAAMPTIKETTTFFQTVMDGRTTRLGKAKVQPDDPARVAIKQLVADLSLTDPAKCFKDALKPGGKTMATNQMTILWAAATNYMGCQYMDENPPPEVNTDTEGMQVESDDDSYDLQALIHKKPLKQSNLTAFTTTTKVTAPAPRDANGKLSTAKAPAATDNNPSNRPTEEEGWTTQKKKPTQISTPKRRYYERFEMRLKIAKGSRTPVRDFQERFGMWYEEAKGMDASLVISPWYKKNKSKGCIVTSADIPAAWKDLRYYIGRANPTSKSEDVYLQILLSSNVDMQMFTSWNTELEGAYQEGEYSYIQDLKDAEHTTEIGFMAYSGNFTKAKQALKVINQLLEEKRAKLKVGGRVKFMGKVSEEVKDQHLQNGGSWYNSPWMALHLHADVKDARRASKLLGKIFNTKDGDRKGLNYRYVPKPGTSVMGAKTAEKVQAMIRKHQNYVRRLKYEQLKGDFALDTKDPETNTTTLREFLARQTVDGSPMIHDVSTTHMADGKEDAIHVVAFEERFAQAVGLIHTIGIRCTSEINQSTTAWFSEDIIAMSSAMIKDDNGEYVDVETEEEMDFLLDEGFGGVIIEGINLMERESSSPKRKKARLEDESFKTFGTEYGKSAASSRYTIPESETEAKEKDDIETELEEAMRMAREVQELEAHRVRVKEQSNQITSQEAIIAALRARLEASGAEPPTSSKGGGEDQE